MIFYLYIYKTVVLGKIFAGKLLAENFSPESSSHKNYPPKILCEWKIHHGDNFSASKEFFGEEFSCEKLSGEKFHANNFQTFVYWYFRRIEDLKLHL